MKNIIKQLKNLYSSSTNLQKLAKLITSSKLYFIFTKKYIASQSQIDLKGPFNLLIETTSFCNAKCIMCPHRIMKRSQKIMTDKTFNKILERIKKEKLPVNKIYLSGFGEPFTDPNFLNRLEKLKKSNFIVSFYTNASLLTKEISQKLIKLKVDEVNISFNAVTKNSYQKVMQLDYKKTKNNIFQLLKLRNQNIIKSSNLKASIFLEQKIDPTLHNLQKLFFCEKRSTLNKKPFIRISSVINKENEKDIKKHFQFWQNKVDLVTVTQAHEWGGVIKNETNYKFIKNQRTYPCRSLWHTFALDAEGNFVLCCRDYESSIKLGNIQTHSFKQIQNSTILKKIKSQHLKYQKEKLPLICQNCNFPYQNGVEWFLPKSLT